MGGPTVARRGLGGPADHHRQLHPRQFRTDECECFTVFWWAWLNDCFDALPSNSHEATIFRIYYAFRLALYFQCFFHTVSKAEIFNLAEKKKRKTLKGMSFLGPPHCL